jgi:hypothetical protein
MAATTIPDDDIQATLRRLEPLIISIHATLPYLATKDTVTRIDATLTATLPTLATKAELTTGLSEVRGEIAAVKVALAALPGKAYLWLVIGTLIVAYAAGLAGLALLPVATKLLH